MTFDLSRLKTLTLFDETKLSDTHLDAIDQILEQSDRAVVYITTDLPVTVFHIDHEIAVSERDVNRLIQNVKTRMTSKLQQIDQGLTAETVWSILEEQQMNLYLINSIFSILYEEDLKGNREIDHEHYTHVACFLINRVVESATWNVAIVDVTQIEIRIETTTL